MLMAGLHGGSEGRQCTIIVCGQQGFAAAAGLQGQLPAVPPVRRDNHRAQHSMLAAFSRPRGLLCQPVEPGMHLRPWTSPRQSCQARLAAQHRCHSRIKLAKAESSAT